MSFYKGGCEAVNLQGHQQYGENLNWVFTIAFIYLAVNSFIANVYLCPSVQETCIAFAGCSYKSYCKAKTYKLKYC